MCLQVRKKHSAVFGRKLKEDQSFFLTSLKTREERVKELEERITELEERNVQVQEHREEEAKEIIVISQESTCIETSDKAIQTLSINANVSNHALATYTLEVTFI